MNTRKQPSCAVGNCLLTFEPHRHFFKFPKEYNRWLQWIHACKRLDLESKGPEYAYRNCRLCHLHFEKKWYKLNKIRARLHPDAVPTIFFNPGFEQQNNTTNGNEKENVVETKINENTSIEVKDEVEGENRNTCIEVKEEVINQNSNPRTIKLFLPIVLKKVQIAKSSTSMERLQNMTKSLDDNPRTKKLLLKIEKLKKKNKVLRQTIRRLRIKEERRSAKVKVNECEQLKKLGRKCLPENCNKILAGQIDAQLKNKHGRRYDSEFKKFALSLYFLSPRNYRELKNSIPLPSIRSLQLFTKKWNVTPGIIQKLLINVNDKMVQ